MKNIIRKTASIFIFPIIFIAILEGVRWQYSDLLFHTLAEFVAIVIAILMAVVAWNTRQFTRNNFLLFLGIGYFGIGALDAMHTLTFIGMPFFGIDNPNPTLRFWILTRFFEAMLLLVAPLFIRRPLNCSVFITIVVIYCLFVCWVALYLNKPMMFVVGEGLTHYKVLSEYLIIITQLLAIIVYIKLRQQFAIKTLRYIIASIVLTISSEFCFTLYTDIHGWSMMLGHELKIISFWMIYKAIIETTLKEPFAMMAKGSNTYDAIPHAACVVNSQGIISQVNRQAEYNSGKQAEFLVHQPIHKLFHPSDSVQAECELCQHIHQAKALQAKEFYFPNSKQWFLISLAPISSGGSIEGMVQTSTIITDSKRIASELQASVEEKEILLREIHHRVKNNMQVICSLLSLQSRKVDNAEVVAALMDSQQRVKTMASIHELLYRSSDMAYITISDLVTQVSSDLLRIYQQNAKHIKLDVRVENIILTLDSAVPVGLIINELLSNALKYAFPDKEHGIIQIRMQKDDEGLVELVVSDNGIGLPKGFNFQHTDTLGIKLILALSEQLHGQAEFVHENGTLFVLKFKEVV